jgi:hypothetical protein
MFHRTAGDRVPHWAVIGLAVLSGQAAWAQSAAPGDVYYKVHLDQKFKYYAFVDDVIVWESMDQEGTSLSATVGHDSTLTYGLVSVSATFDAAAGAFSTDLDSRITLDARTGIFHQLTNTLTVDVYIRGATGTPYWLTVAGDGQVEASRLGGLPGSLQPVNGTSTASFMDSTASVSYTGAVSIPVNEAYSESGTTTAQIVVGADTYSLARSFIFTTPTSVTQALCILGCMQAAAHFDAHGGGRIEIDVYPYVDPAGVPRVAEGHGALAVQASPNPLNAATMVSFQAPLGERTTVQVFDARGRLVAKICDAAATGSLQRVPWRATGLPGGLYFLRVQAGARTSTAKLTLLR